MNSRNKGANGEREFARIIYDQLGVRLVRNLEQTRNGGHDLIAQEVENPVARYIDSFAIEVKRYTAVTESKLNEFMAQAMLQADRAGKEPLLAYRVNRGAWRVCLRLFGSEFYQLSIDAFCYLARECSELKIVDKKLI